MPKATERRLKATLAPRLLLAALVLLLPLIVLSTLVIKDKNTRIAAVVSEVHGIEYLLESRLLLERIDRAFAVEARNADPQEIARSRRDVSDLIVDIGSRLARDSDEFALQPRLSAIRDRWQVYMAEADALEHRARYRRQRDLVTLVLGTIHYVGDRSGLSSLPTLESAYIARLLLRQIPEALVRIGEIRTRTIVSGRTAGTGIPADNRQSLFNEWSLTLAHNRLVEDFRNAASHDPRIDDHLRDTLAAFDAAAHRFHAAIDSPVPATDGSIGNLPPAMRRSETVHTDPADRQTLVELGDAAVANALALFDRAASGLQLLLDRQLRTLARTKILTAGTLAGASLFAAIAGWLLLSAMTRPLQAEIEERMRAEHQARALAAIVESSQDSILVIGLDGRFKSWNRGAERLYGYSAEEAVGQPTSLLAPPALRDETAIAVAAALRNAATPTLETVRKRKDGSLIDVSLRTSPVYNDTGEVTGIAVIGRDITERKKVEAELREKERMLKAHVSELDTAQTELRAHRDHLEELVDERTSEIEDQAAQLELALRQEQEFNALQRKFVAMASHEFRTPLAIIDGSAQRILRRLDRIDASEIAARMDKVRAAVSRMLTLIESTLSISQIEAGKVALDPQPFDIAALVREVCSRQQEISPRHKIRVDLAALPRIVGDLKRLDQVFTNLLSNAVKYAPDSPQIDVVGERHGDTVTIAVTDRGRGIPADELPQLFTRYFRASTSNGIAGTGIGLNLVQELVALHGGAVAVDSTVGTGTTFTVRLPLALPASVDPQPGVPLDDGATSVAA